MTDFKNSCQDLLFPPYGYCSTGATAVNSKSIEYLFDGRYPVVDDSSRPNLQL